MRPQVNVVVAATLALLALLVGFSLTMAVGRYDARRQLVLAEANAISTADLRARLLSSPVRAQLVDRLRQYIDIQLNTTANPYELTQKAETLQGEMMAMVTAVALQEPHPGSVDRFIEALKDLIDIYERRLSTFESFVPEAVLYLLGIAALGGAFVAGYGSGLASHRNQLALTVYAFLICLAILVIVDLDRPARGLIRVSQRSLERQRQHLTAQPAAVPAELAGSGRKIRYRCDDGRDVPAAFDRGDPPRARIERDGAQWILPRLQSASGARYGDGTVTFWEHQDEARLEVAGRATTCRVARSP
jgi:membrane-bound inhibitor of C-type lysozyme